MAKFKMKDCQHWLLFILFLPLSSECLVSVTNIVIVNVNMRTNLICGPRTGCWSTLTARITLDNNTSCYCSSFKVTYLVERQCCF